MINEKDLLKDLELLKAEQSEYTGLKAEAMLDKIIGIIEEYPKWRVSDWLYRLCSLMCDKCELKEECNEKMEQGEYMYCPLDEI